MRHQIKISLKLPGNIGFKWTQKRERERDPFLIKQFKINNIFYKKPFETSRTKPGRTAVDIYKHEFRNTITNFEKYNIFLQFTMKFNNELVYGLLIIYILLNV